MMSFANWMPKRAFKAENRQTDSGWQICRENVTICVYEVVLMIKTRSVMGWAEHVASIGGVVNKHIILVVLGSIQFHRPGHGWQDIINADLQNTRCKSGELVQLTRKSILWWKFWTQQPPINRWTFSHNWMCQQIIFVYLCLLVALWKISGV